MKSLHTKMGVSWLLIFTLFSASACGDGAFATQINVHEKCESWLIRQKSRMSSNWRRFRQEAKEQGPIRYVFAPRTDGKKFNKLASFVDPLIDFPVELISYWRWKKLNRPPLHHRLSIFTALPVGIVAWGLLFNGIESKTEQWAQAGIENSVQSDGYGAAYVAEWIVTGSITPTQGEYIVKHGQAQFAKDLAPLRARINEFQELLLWTPEQAQSFNRVLDRLKALHTPRELFHESKLQELLNGDSEFQTLVKSLPPDREFTSRLLVVPTVVVKGQSDAYWLSVFFEPFRRANFSNDQLKGLASLESIYSFHKANLPLPTLVKLVSDTLTEGSEIQSKISRAEKAGMDLTNNFIYRADIPLFQRPLTFTDYGATVDMRDELDRWKLLLTDVRFKPFRDAWKNGEISDLTVLLKTEMQINALTQVYQLARTDIHHSLDPANACKLIFGEKSVPPNPLFSSLKDVGSRLSLSADKMAQVPTLQYRLADLYMSTFVATSSLKDEKSVEAVYAQASEREKQLLTEAAQGTLPVASQLSSCAVQD